MTRLRALSLAILLLTSRAPGGEIHEAATRGDIALLKTLCARGPAARSSRDKDGFTALHLAVIHRQSEAVSVLIAAGAPVDARDSEGQTPLHHLADSVEESVVANFHKNGGGKFGESLAKTEAGGQPITPAVLLGLLREDLAEIEEPLKLLRNFAAASTAEQMDAELKSARALIAAGADVDALDRERSTPLHHAAMSPRPDLVRTLIEAGAKLDAQNTAGLTPLHNAAFFGSQDTLAFLLDHGADPEGRTILTGVPPLVMAVTRGEPEMVTALLDHHADVNALGPDGETALARAAVLGATDIARVLVERGARVGVRFARINHTPAHAAAARGFVPLLNLLLEHGADPEARDGSGVTPVIDAAEHDRTPAVRALLLAGAKPNTTNNLGRSALWIAASRGYTETAAYLLEHGADVAIESADGQMPLHVAAYNARPAMVRLLLPRRPPLDRVSRLGTPLHCAVAGPLLHAIFAGQAKPGQKSTPTGTPEESTICAKLLVDAGAPLDAADANGATPFQTAAAFGNMDALQLLVSRQKAAPTAAGARGLTALHHAARGPLVPGYSPEAQPRLSADLLAACAETAKFLLTRGASPNARDDAGLTPLHDAAGAGNLPVLKTLLAAKADLRAVDKAGGTPLHWAAARGQTEAVEALLVAHAPTDTADGEGQTPLHLAVAGGHSDAIRVLLDHGANPNMVNRKGLTPLACAEVYHRTDLAKLLRARGARDGAAAPGKQ